MVKKKEKVNKSSNYWCDFEGELSVYYSFVWNNYESIDYFVSNEKEFISKYKLLAIKYGIAIPLEDATRTPQNSSFLSLYNQNGKFFYPTNLFIDVQDEKPYKIISIDPILSLSESDLKFSSDGSIPFRIELFKKETEIQLLCYIENDIFNLELNNKKSRNFGCSIDNSDLAYLNTPRLNSYLKGLKNLCNEFKVNLFKFENLGLEDYTEDGVLFNNEIVCYEDVSDLLPPKNQIVK
jgi:hypothetical protein